MAITTIADAKARIELFTLSSSFPTLSSTEIDTLVKISKRAGDRLRPEEIVDPNVIPLRLAGTVPPDDYLEWAANTVFALGALVVPIPRNGHYYKATVAGTTGATLPAFPVTSGGTVVDGTVTWEEQGAALWTPTFQLAPAIAQGWELKAAKVATAYDFQSSTQTFKRSQMFEQCMEMAKNWKRKTAYTIELVGSLQERNFRLNANANDCNCELSTCWWCYGRAQGWWESPDDLAFGRPWDLWGHDRSGFLY